LRNLQLMYALIFPKAMVPDDPNANVLGR
jgi:hypothetical protein